MAISKVLDMRTGETREIDVPDIPAPVLLVLPADVTAERDRRLRSVFAFQGRLFDSDEQSLQRITGAATLAGFWIGGGGDPASVLWHGGETPFSWISASNEIVQMDAQTVFAMGQAASAHEASHIFAARALKSLDPIPLDFAADSYWPAVAVEDPAVGDPGQ